MRNVIQLTTGLLLGVAACGPEPTPFERSCRGEYVGACRPHELVELTAVTVTPAALAPADPRSTLTIEGRIRTCPSAPEGPRVRLAARLDGAGGAWPIDVGGDVGRSDDTRVYQLGSFANESSEPGAFRAVIPNPFDLRIPANTDLVRLPGSSIRVRARDRNIRAPSGLEKVCAALLRAPSPSGRTSAIAS